MSSRPRQSGEVQIPAAAFPSSDPSVDSAPASKILLRRRSEPQLLTRISPALDAAVCVFDRVLASGRSEVLLTWPQRIDGIAIIHALASLVRLGDCDSKRLATLFFPWNRNSANSQRHILVDREFIYRETLPPLNRTGPQHYRDPALGYIMGLHSLNHVLSSGKSGTRLSEALKSDPGLGHPTLFEIMPQHGIQSEGLHRYDDQFLRRLQRYTWITKRDEYMDAATDPQSTPFFLFGVDTDALQINKFREADLDPEHDGRVPDILLIDVTSRARARMNNNWQAPLQRLLDLTLELYLDACPPVLAVTDDVFSFQTLSHDLIKQHDRWRAANIQTPVRAIRGGIVLTPKADPLDQQIMMPGPAPAVTAEVYGTDLLRVVATGMKLRRSFDAAGHSDIGDLVATAANVIQNLVGLPGQPQQFHEFLAAHYDGYERQSRGARFDHHGVRNKINAVLKAGLAGSSHTQLAEFLVAFDELRGIADADNPGRRRFDDCIRQMAQHSIRSIVVFTNDLQVLFADWRIENDPALADLRTSVGSRLVLLDKREVIDELDRGEEETDPIERIVFIEPRADDFLHVITHRWLPKRVVILANLARIEQILRRTRILLGIPGIDPAAEKLRAVQAELERALGGHTSDIGDLDGDMGPPQFGTLDLTASGGLGIGKLRLIRVSGNCQIRAFDGSEFALYEPEGLQHFSRKLAKDLRTGDQICVFSPDFVGMVRERLKFSANAPDVLKLYHTAVAEAAERLPGYDMTAKSAALRARMLQIDPMLQLPGAQSIRNWIEVADLIEAPRHAVRPQAPRDRHQCLCFMKALNISDDVARHFWDFGIFWTRSSRIKSGASFHQQFMGILIDPYGSASLLPENTRCEIWRIYDLAEDHVAAVVSNELEGGK
jgi:hypothetical protein